MILELLASLLVIHGLSQPAAGCSLDKIGILGLHARQSIEVGGQPAAAKALSLGSGSNSRALKARGVARLASLTSAVLLLAIIVPLPVGLAAAAAGQEGG